MTDFTQKRTKPAKAQGYQKREVGKNVYDLALERIRYVYDLFDTIAVSFSGGKDSITGDAKVWIKVDGVLVYTTIATLVDDYVIIGEVENQDDGSMIIYPANRIEIPSATSTGQIDAKVE